MLHYARLGEIEIMKSVLLARGARFVDYSVRCSGETPKHPGAKVLGVIVAYDYLGKTLAARFNAEYRSSEGTLPS